MAIEKIEAYRAICDECQEQYESEMFAIFGEQESLNEFMTDDDWFETDDGKVYCPKCRPEGLEDE